MAQWILKTEPSTYSYDDLARERSTVWDGVKNPVALRNIRTMRKGDPVLIYHTGSEKAIVGRAVVVSAPYPDPRARDSKLVVVEVKATGRVKTPVTLAQIKAEPAFADLALVRQGRLSVVSATAAQWKRLLAMAGVR